MPDPRLNDVSRKLRNLAADLDAKAAAHRRLANELDRALRARPGPPAPLDPYVVAERRAAEELVELPAAEIRRQAPEVARRHGVHVLSVALAAAQLRRQARAQARRTAALAVMQALAQGKTLREAGQLAGVSEATACRLRQEWIEGRFAG